MRDVWFLLPVVPAKETLLKQVYCLTAVSITSTLCPKKTSNRTPHLYTVATLPWEIQKVIFQQYYSYILQINYVISEETNCYFLTHYTWKMSPHYLVKIAQIFHLFHFFMCIEYQFAIRTSCWTAASCCDMGWSSAQRGELHSWSVAKKTGSMYPCRRC